MHRKTQSKYIQSPKVVTQSFEKIMNCTVCLHDDRFYSTYPYFQLYYTNKRIIRSVLHI